MKTSKQEYEQMVKKASPPSPTLKNCAWAFLVGGAICTVGQLLKTAYMDLGLDADAASAGVSVTIILVTAICTGFGWFDKLAKHAGAGTLVPISGFANAMVSPAIEFKTEGFVLGMAAKMFVIAGPVIVYGTVASVIYGIIYWICSLF